MKTIPLKFLLIFLLLLNKTCLKLPPSNFSFFKFSFPPARSIIVGNKSEKDIGVSACELGLIEGLRQ